MLKNVSKRINEKIRLEEFRENFRDIIREDSISIIDNLNNIFLKKLNENGDDYSMLRDEHDYLFNEDTQSDAELTTSFQDEVWQNDTDKWNEQPDYSELTDLQEPVDFSDNYSTDYSSDSDPNNFLNKEVTYNDVCNTVVDTQEFSNEAAEFLLENSDDDEDDDKDDEDDDDKDDDDDEDDEDDDDSDDDDTDITDEDFSFLEDADESDLDEDFSFLEDADEDSDIADEDFDFFY